MAFLVQDDNGTVDNANAYVSIADFESYANDRGYDLSSYDNTAKEQAIIKSTDYIDISNCYYGTQVSKTQGTQFPRLINGVSSGIPESIKRSCYEYSWYSIQGNSFYVESGDTSGGIIKERDKVGDLETERQYSPSKSSSGFVSVPIADSLIKKSGYVYNTNGLLIRG